jgi:hypothetical protein
MEMAMARNQVYFESFSDKIQRQEFSVIISEIHVDSSQDLFSPFGYENNTWVENVSQIILKYYRCIYKNEDIGIGVYEPLGK